MERFILKSPYKPTGDQPEAIKRLSKGILGAKKYQVLLGITGSGKTFTLANAIEKVNKPTLIISHNKTLAAQLYSEFKSFFPENAVEYFVSYYDYYQPEAYIPTTDTYIEKDASINEKLDTLRLSATSSLMSRRDVIIVASVSCIYNLGSPEDYEELILWIEQGQQLSREELLKKLTQLQYERNEYDFKRGAFRIRGDSVDIFPTYKKTALRIELNIQEKVEGIYIIDPVSSDIKDSIPKVGLYPAKHFIVGEHRITDALGAIRKELKKQVAKLEDQGKIVEAKRLLQRTKYDLEMLEQTGYCYGIENYSRQLSSREPGSRPFCLIDYFDDDFLTVIDESHVSLPQIRGMHAADKARKETLVEHGFRLPSCLDNRPLKFDEFMSLQKQMVFVSATPQEYEINLSNNTVIEQLIRPTGIIDPEITIKPTENQIQDLIEQIKISARKKERVLVTTLTKRMAEDLTQFLKEEHLNAKYIHSEVKTIERTKILQDLRKGEFDALVGINLLREGLDLPEVSLVAILDADKEGFLRSFTSLIQTAGRAARNVKGRVILYADTMTGSIKKVIDETSRRRKIQLRFNKKYNITASTVAKSIKEGIELYHSAENLVLDIAGVDKETMEVAELIIHLTEDMQKAARNLHFEKAAFLRDKIKELKSFLKKKGKKK